MAGSGKLSDTAFLKAKFVVGSVHGRASYQPEERVFHTSDMPQFAKEARVQVDQILKSRKLDRHQKHWDIGSSCGHANSGSKRAPWDDDGWDDRRYHKKETDYLVNKARQRIEDIRTRAREPPPSGNQWNISTYYEQPKPPLLSVGSNAIVHKPVKDYDVKKPKMYTTLVDRHDQKVGVQRQRKEEERRAREQKQKIMEDTFQFAHEYASHPDNDFVETSKLERYQKPDPKQIQSNLESTYTADALTDYLATLDKQKEEKQQQQHTQARSRSRTGRTTMMWSSQPRTMPRTNARLANNELVTPGTLRRTGSPITAAQMGLSAAGTTTANATRRRPRQYEHRGTWAQHSSSEEEWTWSCCMNGEKGSRGCLPVPQPSVANAIFS